ncbi:hypothetical protein AQUCO_04000029v1 [Aquilegia coerulea]|uniref:SGNH hydrolase-type esterase domain-containing protein n=1 Tax=Aquilegia coerulea TaxID=218851 RepID=A0A2G5CQU2_AQUCA|nr:hypothetical protein AQUCO_04000029v1 [Aquilegia coerulea]
MVKGEPQSCNFQAIYNFGDSNSDTGGISAVYNPIPPPNGQTYFGKPAGRVTDGRIVIDFMAKNPSENAYLPNPDEFLNALYTFDIGQNDLSHVIGKVPNDQALAIIPDMIQEYSTAIQKMYQQGARSFCIHNLGPLGCSPIPRLSVISGGSQDLDQYGCVKYHNDIVSQFNQQLKNLIYQQRGQLKLRCFISLR